MGPVVIAEILCIKQMATKIEHHNDIFCDLIIFLCDRVSLDRFYKLIIKSVANVEYGSNWQHNKINKTGTESEYLVVMSTK
jgi:hypothetical protein